MMFDLNLYKFSSVKDFQNNFLLILLLFSYISSSKNLECFETIFSYFCGSLENIKVTFKRVCDQVGNFTDLDQNFVCIVSVFS